MAPADWIAFASVAFTVAAAVAAAYWQSHRAPAAEVPAGDREERLLALTPADRKILLQLQEKLGAVTLNEADRRLIVELRDTNAGLRDVGLTLGRRIDANTDAQAESRRALEDNTAALERRRGN